MRKIYPVAALIILLITSHSTRAVDEDLGAMLATGEEWKIAAEGLGFTDGLTCDREGNLYFSDLRAKPAVIIDYDKAGNVVGIEILDASTRMDNPRSVEYAVAG